MSGPPPPPPPPPMASNSQSDALPPPPPPPLALNSQADALPPTPPPPPAAGNDLPSVPAEKTGSVSALSSVNPASTAGSVVPPPPPQKMESIKYDGEFKMNNIDPAQPAPSSTAGSIVPPPPPTKMDSVDLASVPPPPPPQPVVDAGKPPLPPPPAPMAPPPAPVAPAPAAPAPAAPAPAAPAPAAPVPAAPVPAATVKAPEKPIVPAEAKLEVSKPVAVAPLEAKDLSKEALKDLEPKEMQMEELSKAVSLLPDPLTIFFGELAFLLLINTIYAPVLKTWLMRIFVPPILLITAGLGFIWKRRYEAPDRKLQALNEVEKKTVQQFEERLNEKKAELDAKEKLLLQEEEKLKAVRGQLQQKIGQRDIVETGADKSAHAQRGVVLGSNNNVEIAGAATEKRPATERPPRTMDKNVVLLDQNMLHICEHSFEPFQVRSEVIAARVNLGVEASNLSREELSKKSKADSFGVVNGILGEIRPHPVPYKPTRPNLKLLRSRGLADGLEVPSRPLSDPKRV